MLTSLQNSEYFTEAFTFIEAIRANPRDNTVRLVFADWLDEHAQIEGCEQWAELIRLQCSMAATCPTAFFNAGGKREEYAHIHQRIRELMPQVAAMSEVKFPDFSQSDRGFFIAGEALRPLNEAEFIKARNAHPERLLGLSLHNYSDLGDLQKELARHGTIYSELTSLDLSHTLPRNNMQEEVGQPAQNYLQPLAGLDATNLTSLNLTGNRLNAASVRVLAECGNLSNLTWLNLTHNNLGTEGIVELANCQNLSGLTHLNLSKNDLNAASIRELANCQNLSRLTYLNLSGNGFLSDFFSALAFCKNLPCLTSLSIETTGMREEDTAPLRKAIATGILPNKQEGEALPSLQWVHTGNAAHDAKFAEAFAARALRNVPNPEMTVDEFEALLKYVQTHPNA